MVATVVANKINTAAVMTVNLIDLNFLKSAVRSVSGCTHSGAIIQTVNRTVCVLMKIYCAVYRCLFLIMLASRILSMDVELSLVT